MAEPTETRVAVYIDFDNIVISQYDNVHGRGSFIKEKARAGAGKTAERLEQATVNIGAILDFASSFGAVAISRAYADWAAPANTRYQKQLIERADVLGKTIAHGVDQIRALPGTVRARLLYRGG